MAQTDIDQDGYKEVELVDISDDDAIFINNRKAGRIGFTQLLTWGRLKSALATQIGSISGSDIALGDLSNVNAAAPSDDEVLGWDAGTGKWTPRAPSVGGGGGATTLDELTDVVIAGQSDGDVLTWNAGLNRWQADAVPVSGGPSTLDSLTDVVATSPANGNVLTFDSGSGHWVPAAPSGGGSGLPTTGGTMTGQVIFGARTHSQILTFTHTQIIFESANQVNMEAVVNLSGISSQWGGTPRSNMFSLANSDGGIRWWMNFFQSTTGFDVFETHRPSATWGLESDGSLAYLCVQPYDFGVGTWIGGAANLGGTGLRISGLGYGGIPEGTIVKYLHIATNQQGRGLEFATSTKVNDPRVKLRLLADGDTGTGDPDDDGVAIWVDGAMRTIFRDGSGFLKCA